MCPPPPHLCSFHPSTLFPSLSPSKRAFLQLEHSYCHTRVDKTGWSVSISVMCVSMWMVCESMKSISSGSDMQYNHISTITHVPAQPARNCLCSCLWDNAKNITKITLNQFYCSLVCSCTLSLTLTWHHVCLIKLTLKRLWHHHLAVILLDVFGLQGSHGNFDVMATQTCFQENHSWHVVK